MEVNKLSKAKSALILDQPFFASILLGLPMVEDKNIPTMATNGDEIRYNPDFLNTLSLSETVFVLAHETMHCVFQHMHRRGTRDHNKWNQAGDYVINDTLIRERVGTMPQGGLHNSALVVQGNGTTEGVYDLLPKGSQDKQCGDMDAGGSMDNVQDASKDPAELKAKEQEMRVKIVQAANAAKMCGKLSSGLERMVKDLVTPKVDWKNALRTFFTERAKVDLSYARPKRRFLAEDLYLPSQTGHQLGEVVVAIDCSGSIDETILKTFASELQAIKTDTMPSKVHVLYFDSKVLKTETYEADEELNIKPCGGGGTAFSPIFEYIDTQGIVPAACVVLTDLQCTDFGAGTSYPVLWATTDLEHAPFGTVLKIK